MIDNVKFEALFKAYYEGMFRYCHTMVRNIPEAEDIVQSVFLDLWKDREKVEIHTSIQAFLYKGVYFKCMNTIKHKKIEHRHAQLRVEEASEVDPAIYNEVAQNIQSAIDSLPEQCKKIFVLSRYDGMRYQEIADHLNLSIKTIENQMGKALKTMRVALSEYLHIIVLHYLIFGI